MQEIKFTLIYWYAEETWIGKLMELPHIRAEAPSLEELQYNIKAAYVKEVMTDVPEDYAVRTIII